MIFDNTKIKAAVPDFNPQIPFSEGVKEIVAWYEADASRQTVDKDFNDLTERILKDYNWL
jgi:dTDP-D-glucose 4,6-dehydratase